MILFVNLMNFMIDPVAELPALLAGRKAAMGLIEKLAEALEKDPAPKGGENLPVLEREIRLEGVSFSYDGQKQVLHSLSARFEAGKAYALVGGSGSGKSTLLNLLMGAGAAYEGKILMDGREVRDLSPESLYGLMSVIQQNVFVFNASVRDNVTMFRSFPQEELEQAMGRAWGGLSLRRERKRSQRRGAAENFHCKKPVEKVADPSGGRSHCGAGCPDGPPGHIRSAGSYRSDQDHCDSRTRGISFAPV